MNKIFFINIVESLDSKGTKRLELIKKQEMKFNWGTGIFTFLALFLLAAAAFIIFAVRQDVNLVHKDYYEKGVDYTEQMNVEARSEKFSNAFTVSLQNDFLMLEIDDILSAKIDSGSILLFRPSSSKKDVIFQLTKSPKLIHIPKEDLTHGRYILKFFWYSEGLKYEVDQPVNIQ